MNLRVGQAPSLSRGGLGWGWVGACCDKNPISLPASSLKGEENISAIQELVA